MPPLCVVWCGRLRGGARDLRSHHDPGLPLPDRGLAPALPRVRGEGGAGVREGGHLQTGQTTSRGQQGAR